MPVLKNNYQRSKNSHDGGHGRALGASAMRAVPSRCGATHRGSVPRALLEAKPSPRQSIYFILSFVRQNRRRDVSGVLKQKPYCWHKHFRHGEPLFPYQGRAGALQKSTRQGPTFVRLAVSACYVNSFPPRASTPSISGWGG